MVVSLPFNLGPMTSFPIDIEDKILKKFPVLFIPPPKTSPVLEAPLRPVPTTLLKVWPAEYIRCADFPKVE